MSHESLLSFFLPQIAERSSDCNGRPSAVVRPDWAQVVVHRRRRGSDEALEEEPRFQTRQAQVNVMTEKQSISAHFGS